MSLPISTPTNPQEKTGVIYRIYHKKSMKSYIGKTVDPERRIRDHFNGRGKCKKLQHAIKKYGKDAFVVEFLEKDIPESQLSKMEILYIRFFNSKGPNGYNLTYGGEGTGGFSHSQETRRKISEAKKGNAWNIGKSSAMKGRTHSLETRRKMSEARKGKNNHFYGVRFSTEHRQKLSEVRRRPDYNEVRVYYFLAVPLGMSVKENLRQLREAFPHIPRRTIYDWVKKWGTERSSAK